MDFVSQSFDLYSTDRCIVIGEIGVNHNRDYELLFKLIDAGIDAGVDIIKLQRFSSEAEISEYAPSADYQRKAGQGDSQLEMAKKLELPDEWLVKAYDYCKSKNAGFLCAGFDHESVDFIADNLDCKSIKSPSPEITNKPLLQHMASKFEGIIVSTGASYLDECKTALNWIQDTSKTEVCFMHCLSEYPAPLDQINLRVLDVMKKTLGVPIGYSDHTVGILAPALAAACGSVIVEKHYTLDKNLPGPDHAASTDIDELKALVRDVRLASQSLGDGIKAPVAAEEKNRALIRKTLTANASVLEIGTVITEDLVGIKRPAVEGAITPSELDQIIGKVLKVEKTFDQPLFWCDFDEG